MSKTTKKKTLNLAENPAVTTDIFIDWDYEYKKIKKLKIIHDYTDHQRLNITFSISKKYLKEFMSRINTRDSICVRHINKEANLIFFSGRMENVEFKVVNKICYMILDAVSYTADLDIVKRQRSFQYGKMKYKELVNEVLKKKIVSYEFLEHSKSKLDSNIAIQYKETDWEFLKRIASRFNKPLVAKATGKKIEFSIGFPKIPNVIPDFYLQKYTIFENYQDSSKLYRSGTIRNSLYNKLFSYGTCEFKLNEWFPLGTKLYLNGKEYLICKITGKLVKEILVFKYTASVSEGLLQPTINNENFSGAALIGKVIDVSEKKVKLHLDIDKTQSRKAAHWFSYAPEANNVWELMPEIGERVRLYFPSSKESEAYIINSVRSEPSQIKAAEVAKKMSDPGEKSITTSYGKNITLGKSNIAISAKNEELLIEMKDDVVSLKSNASIEVNADNEILLTVLDKLVFKAKENIFFHVKGIIGNSSIILNDGIHISGPNVLVGQEKQNESKNTIDESNNQALEFQNDVDDSSLLEEGKENKHIPYVRALNEDGTQENTAKKPLSIVNAAGPQDGIARNIPSNANEETINPSSAVNTAGPQDGIARNIPSNANEETINPSSAVNTAGPQDGIARNIPSNVNEEIIVYNENILKPQNLNDADLAEINQVIVDTELLYAHLFQTGANELEGEIDPNLTASYYANLDQPQVLTQKSKKVDIGDWLAKQGFDPVNLITGAMFYEAVDIEFPGSIPFRIERRWSSDVKTVGYFGNGMHTNFEMKIEEQTGDVIDDIQIVLSDGRVVIIPQILDGMSYYEPREKIELSKRTDQYELFNHQTRTTYLFHKTNLRNKKYNLRAIINDVGHKIQLQYGEIDQLKQIIDSAGRIFDITMNTEGRIIEITYKNQSLVKYLYNKEQDLIEVRDALGQSVKMKYQNHLMFQKIDKNKNSFYWEYDNKGRVTHTWGDGKVLEGWIRYFDGYNEIEDSLGNISYYYFDENKICSKIVHPDGTETFEEHNHQFELTRTRDEEGRETKFTYNERSKLLTITRTDGSVITYAYDNVGRLISVTNPKNETRQWIYNADNTLQKIVTEDGTETVFTYNEQNLVETVINNKDDEINLYYDKHGNLAKVTAPDGNTNTWEYDKYGNCKKFTNALGAAHIFSYDALNRLVEADFADGNKVELTYNGRGEVIQAKDNHANIKFDYTILGNLKTREQKGKKIEFTYNTEELLTGFINEKGDKYQFERDMRGNVKKEINFDGLTKTYERNSSGQLQKINRPEGRWTSYKYDESGKIKRADYFDGTWETFGYDQNGALIEVSNEHVTIKLELDSLGRVIKEWQNGHFIENVYDEFGLRKRLTSNLGADIDIKRDNMGSLIRIKGGQREDQTWIAHRKHNKLDQEIEWILPGDVISRWQYDNEWKLIKHKVKSQKQKSLTRSTQYSYDVNKRLRAMKNELTGELLNFGYDENANLIWSKPEKSFEYLYRSVDDTNNIYETKERDDRVYGKNGQLLESKEAEFIYDEEGNLIEKVEKKSGKIWRYEYYGNNLMSKVIRPDGEEVSFLYDPLGRRIEKRTGKKTFKYIWDDNTILHEYEVSNLSESLITWVYEDGFTPSAKITNKGNFSIVCNHIGTPVEAYSEEGNRVWSIELDIYGRVRNAPIADSRYDWTCDELDNTCFIPFRYQGQYHDVETELYYNRFRYYSPRNGMYTQIDSIGLDGGNPTLYSYVMDTNSWIDPLGLSAQLIIRACDKHSSIGLKIESGPQYYVGQVFNRNKPLGALLPDRNVYSWAEGLLISEKDGKYDEVTYNINDNQVDKLFDYIKDFNSINSKKGGYNALNRTCKNFTYGAAMAVGIDELKINRESLTITTLITRIQNLNLRPKNLENCK